MKLKFKKDTEFVFRDWTDSFKHSKIIITKDTIIDVSDTETDIWNGQYCITFDASKYNEKDVKVEIIKESENDENDVEVLRNMDCYININVDDVEVID